MLEGQENESGRGINVDTALNALKGMPASPEIQEALDKATAERIASSAPPEGAAAPPEGGEAPAAAPPEGGEAKAAAPQEGGATLDKKNK